MIRFRTVNPMCSIFATAVLALAQAPAPPVKPAPPVPPAPPAIAEPFDWVDDRLAGVRERLFELEGKFGDMAVPKAFDMDELNFKLKELLPPKPPTYFDFKGLPAPMAFAQSMAGPGGAYAKFRTNANDDHLYQNGQRALDDRHWDDALEAFSQVASRAGSRADGALYWKAYTLNKLGRRDEASAAIGELRKSYASSRWMDDAKALELEVRQASGRPVSPEQEIDEDLKVLALNGLMQSDPERAFPLLENLLKGAQSPKLKRNALYVLAQNNSPRAQQLLEQVARGGGNPDLQLRAISYLGERRKANGAQVLAEIYAASNDVNVKRAILNSFANNRDKDHLLQAAKSEKNPELRVEAIHRLGDYAGRDAAIADTLVSIYTAEQDPQIKRSIVDTLCSQHNAKALVDMARAEKDSKMKLAIVERLSTMKNKEASDYLMEILK